MKTRTIPATEFKNSCLKLMEDVRKQHVPLTVTKRGKPYVRIVPISESPRSRSLRGTIVRAAANIFSTGERWDADT
ncbi:MAG: type II toxin-antitoxin system Phd/YefM family antitoxin [Deltaproteobacteria bacterium]|jgi:prevent-host-death family protein|nr:type II toxin-antitoxin system Phd/YefM family antitoxin [Deltaproteobacteria bacterium]MBI3390831.1 type II toxin-antitoxin system Phd/YefM family antitoxin [Deltaproteobacteria bacterium]